MKEELTQAELDEIFYGKKPVVSATFYSEQVLDVEASRAAGQRVNKTRDYVHLKCIKEDTEIRRPAQVADQRAFPREWAEYQSKQVAANREEQQHGQVQDTQDEGRVGVGVALARTLQA